MLCIATAPDANADEAVDPAALDGTTIDSITIVRRNVFDLSDPAENNALYRLTNRFHIVTRESTVRKQLLFAEGDGYDARVAEETERILRRNKYLYDAEVSTSLNDDSGVDLTVTTRDVWTLTPEVSFSRSGGEDSWALGVEESNLFGRGQRIQLSHADNVDRTSNIFEYSDRNIGNSWLAADLRLTDSSDGNSAALSIAKPFHALDARQSAGFSFYDDDRRTALYNLGNAIAEYRHERLFQSVFGGWSAGLRDNWVTRWTAGFSRDENEFSIAEVPTLPAALPADRMLSYPFVGIELLEDRFEKSANGDQIGRSEDFFVGTRFAASLGWSDTRLNADRDALLYWVSASHAIGSLQSQALFLSADLSGREESGNSANALVRIGMRYYRRQSERRLFFVNFDATLGHEVDLDNPIRIGGNSGLRGYPLRYQSGDSRALISIEQRYYTDWYPFRLLRVGGAVFFDAGRTWGENPLGGRSLGWLKDVGFGLRLAPTRLDTTKVFHIDIAFPLDGDPSVDSVQVLFEGKRSF